MKRFTKMRCLAVFAALASIGFARHSSAQIIDNDDIVLQLNVTTGAASILNTGATAFTIDSYVITSEEGLLDTTSWSSIAPIGGWAEITTSSATGLGELNSGAGLNLAATTGSQAIGSPFTTDIPTLAAAQTARGGLGNAYITPDLDFLFTNGTSQFRGDIQLVDVLQNNLVLEVETNTGNVSFRNESALDVEVDFLQITSATNLLSASNYEGLASSRAGWTFNSGQNTNAMVAEFFPGTGGGEGDTFIGRSPAVSLGELYDETLDPADPSNRDLEVLIHIVGGNPNGYTGLVRYVEGSVGGSGDFDGSGFVDGADFLRFQRDFPTFDLADFQATYGTAGSTASIAGVPEPSGLLLIGLCSGCLLANRMRN